MVLGKLDILMQKKGIGSTPLTEISLKWSKDSHIRPEIIKLLQENIGSTFLRIGLRKFFFFFWSMPLPSRQGEKKQKINKWDNTKLKSFYKVKDVNKTKKATY